MRLRPLPLSAAIGTAAIATCLAIGISQRSGGQSPAVDPGVRLGSADAGGALPGLTSGELTFFTNAQTIFQEIDSVGGTLVGEHGRGLGPRFNSNGCASCHANPVSGGDSPSTNPQVAVATLHGATNTIPSFVTINGPVVEARFLSDGAVRQLFTIAGRSDAPPTCNLPQPTFTPGSYALRVPNILFGLGLLENVPDAALRGAQDPSYAGPLGITTGVYNIASTGLISRFGWKAQAPSIYQFNGEAYNVEIGVSNEVSPAELATGACEPNTTPEDTTPPAGGNSDVSNFSGFIRLLAPPTPEPGGYSTATTTVSAASISNGQAMFHTAGCDACHIPTLTTTTSPYTGQNNVIFHPFTDLALHNMGSGLADGITQGGANGSQFRSAPLWGLGKRLFFLHDGRVSNLMSAIGLHASTGSEANTVITNFNSLSIPNQQDLLNYLRSL